MVTTRRPVHRRLAALSLVATVLLGACGDDDEPTATAGDTEAPATDGVAGAGPSAIPDGTVLRVADQLGGLEEPLRFAGELDDVPYEIEFSSYGSGPLVNEALAAGQVDIGPMGDTPALLAEATGLDTTIVGVSETDNDGALIMTTAGTGIETLADLEGRTVAYTTGSNQQGIVLRALDSVGLTEDDIEQVDVPLTDVANVVAAGNADAGVVYDFFRPAFLAQQPDAVSLAAATDFVPNYGFLLALDEAVDDPVRSAAIEDFVARVARARQFVQDNQDEWIQAYYIDFQGQDPAVADDLADLAGITRSVPIGGEVQEAQQEQADLLFAAGALPEAVDLSPQFDPERTERFNAAIEAALADAGAG